MKEGDQIDWQLYVIERGFFRHVSANFVLDCANKAHLVSYAAYFISKTFSRLMLLVPL